MVNITLDTNILTGLSSQSATLETLTNLINSNVIKIFLPYIVKKEFETQNKEKINKMCESKIKDLNKAKSTIERIFLNKTIIEEFDSLMMKIHCQFDDYKKLANNNVDDKILSKLKAEILPITESQAINSFEDYFNGNLPFKEPKTRNDIPDSFICRAIEELQKNLNDKIYIVSEDKKIIDTFSNRDKYQVFRSLGELIDSKILQALLKYPVNITNLNFITSHEPDCNYITEYLEANLGEKLITQNIYDDSIFSEDNEATINSYQDGYDIKIDLSNPIFYAENIIGFKFSSKIEVNADFYISKSEYYLNDCVFYVEDWNRHYYLAENEFNLKVTGIVTLNFSSIYSDIKNFIENEKMQQEVEVFDLLYEISLDIEEIDSIELD